MIEILLYLSKKYAVKSAVSIVNEAVFKITLINPKIAEKDRNIKEFYIYMNDSKSIYQQFFEKLHGIEK